MIVLLVVEFDLFSGAHYAWRSPRFADRITDIGPDGEAFPHSKECLLWVKSGSPAWASECPLLGEEQTSISGRWMSAFSQNRSSEGPEPLA